MKAKMSVIPMALFLAAAGGAGLAAQDEPGSGMESGSAVHQGDMHGQGRRPGMQGETGSRGAMAGARAFMRGEKKGFGAVTEEEALAIIKKQAPAFSAKLEGLKASAPAKYEAVMDMAGKMLGGRGQEKNESYEKDAVRELELEYDTRDLARGYEKASEADKAKIKAEAKVKVEELFDLRLKSQAARIDRMEKEVAKLKQKLEARKAGKAKIVNQRIEQLTGEGYGW